MMPPIQFTSAQRATAARSRSFIASSQDTEGRNEKKINSFKIITGFFFTAPLFLATKVAISFVYYLTKTTKCTQKPKTVKKFTGIDQSSERATSYLQLALAHAHNSRVKKAHM